MVRKIILAGPDRRTLVSAFEYGGEVEFTVEGGEKIQMNITVLSRTEDPNQWLISGWQGERRWRVLYDFERTLPEKGLMSLSE